MRRDRVAEAIRFVLNSPICVSRKMLLTPRAFAVCPDATSACKYMIYSFVVFGAVRPTTNVTIDNGRREGGRERIASAFPIRTYLYTLNFYAE